MGEVYKLGMRYLLVLLLLLAPFGQARATTLDLHVWGEQSMQPGVTDHYSSIVVHPSGVLRLLPGSVLQLLPGAQLRIEGVLEARGTPDQPVQVRASSLDQSFGRVEVVGRADFEHTVIEGSGGVRGERLSFSDVVLRDGNPVIELVGTGSQYAIGTVRFENLREGSRMQEMGIRVEGVWDKVDLRKAVFPMRRHIPQAAQLQLIVVTGEVTRGIHWPNQAVPECETEVVQSRLRIRSCSNVQLPVLFVPGYGTSINLAHLVRARQAPEVTQSGWGFISSLTRPYQELLAALEAATVPYEVAYYDWRIPSERAMQEYLLPALRRLKERTGADSVHVVAHSFGGILTQQYLAWDGYAGDIATATLIGTPSKGSPKAYAPWEGGVLPSDWAVVGHLIRTYGVQREGVGKGFLERIRSFIPSLQELMPEPSLVRGPLGPSEQLVWQSPVQQLFAQRSARIAARTQLTTVVGTGRETYPWVSVAVPGTDVWEDGVAEAFQVLDRVGDGTVPASSVYVPGARSVTYEAGHLDLVRVALPTISEQIGTQLTPVPLPERRMKWFVVDCPVDVQVVLPTGELVRAGTDPDTFVSEEATWLVVPELPGTYQLEIYAREDTEVRWWVDNGVAQRFTQTAGTTRLATWPEPARVAETLEKPLFVFAEELPTFSFQALAPWPSFSLQTLALTWLGVGN